MKTINIISDPGHAWAAVPRSELAELGVLSKISPYSYQKNEMVYVEEDCDLAIYINAMNLKRDELKFDETFQEVTPIRNYYSFHPTMAERLVEGCND